MGGSLRPPLPLDPFPCMVARVRFVHFQLTFLALSQRHTRLGFTLWCERFFVFLGIFLLTRVVPSVESSPIPLLRRGVITLALTQLFVFRICKKFGGTPLLPNYFYRTQQL